MLTLTHVIFMDNVYAQCTLGIQICTVVFMVCSVQLYSCVQICMPAHTSVLRCLSSIH